ncbi:unnamed protein product (macronuclear) [Paramecium tetraurelia]|uniref:Protein kinase domain-containing protein n=1 Tax=Paramecium tetraurelia TaxID=5888 RepID=A0C745_PARTE|nr:uncharacterized protein GSPATT00035742001 [Paramecium tetraurelia]CAK66612.1 unnamed protein product [Paramecium tetraurelia]|eukprot:XP_001434009.1 hypothetical protein (macronuclear) [Paramecium tetraurelia strain d4-2]
MAQRILNSGPLDETQTIIQEKFLSKEKLVLSKCIPQNKSHIRNLTYFGMKEQNLKYQTEEDNAESLEKWLLKQKNVDYWNILSQLLVGISQIHQLGFIGRSIKYEEIRVINNNLIYRTFDYADRLNCAPENKVLKFSTYETDLWLIGAIMWRIIKGNSIYEELQQSDNINEIKLTFNFQRNEAGVDEELYQLLSKMLQIYQNNRISLVQIFQYPKLNLPSTQIQTICNFYQKIQLKTILKFRKNSFLRDYSLYQSKPNLNPRIFCFYLEDSPILRCFYQHYVEIQLLSFAYHLSFYFPNKDPNVQKELDKLIIQKMILVSKQLKQQIILTLLPTQFKGQEELFINDPNYHQLKNQVITQLNKLIEMNKKYFQDSELLKMQEIDQKFNSYSTDGSVTLMSYLLINILKNSSVNEKSNIYIQSLTLEEIFENEVQERLK